MARIPHLFALRRSHPRLVESKHLRLVSRQLQIQQFFGRPIVHAESIGLHRIRLYYNT